MPISYYSDYVVASNRPFRLQNRRHERNWEMQHALAAIKQAAAEIFSRPEILGPSARNHSCRKASMGSIKAAFRAG
jgi:hypothetical protein